MDQTFAEFAASAEGAAIVQRVLAIAPQDVADVVLIACYQARICVSDPNATRRSDDSAFREEARSPKYKRAAREWGRLLRQFPEQLQVPIAFALKAAGLSAIGNPAKAVEHFMHELGALLDQEFPGLSKDKRGGYLHRQRHFNLLLGENLDAGKRGRRLPSKATCLAFEIEYIHRCWHAGWSDASSLLRMSGAPLPATDRTFYQESVAITDLALGAHDSAYIEARTLEQFIRRHPDTGLMNWPD